MKRILINTLKKYHWIYTSYYYFFSYIIKLFGFFIRSNKNVFFIVCTGGKVYGDNIRPVYEALLEDIRFKDWNFVWAFRDPENFKLPDSTRTTKCKIDTPQFLYNALKAKCWLTNVSVQRGLNFKNKGTYYINTWHGVPLKHIGLDIKEGTSFKVLGGVEKFDLICTMGTYDAQIAESAFGLDLCDIKVTGYPRNDIMFTEDMRIVRDRVKTYLDIDFSKKIVLYAPTFRDYNKDNFGSFYFELTLSADKFRKVLGDDYILIVRAHGAIESSGVEGYIDATSYPDVEDLLRISDYLITDYSGIMFDYSLLEKPVICFAYDLSKYSENRGLYVNYKDFIPFPICVDEDELYRTIKELDYKQGCEIAREFVKKCGLIGSNASKNVVNAIYDGLKCNA